MNADFLNNCFGLDGRTVVVTGAGSGLGRQAALTLSAAGAHVALLGRRLDGLEETARMVREQAGQATVYPTDVSDEAAVEASLDAICAQCPPLWGLVNNAGVGGRFMLTQANAANTHNPILMTDCQRMQDTLHNAVIGNRPPLSAIAAAKGDTGTLGQRAQFHSSSPLPTSGARSEISTSRLASGMMPSSGPMRGTRRPTTGAAFHAAVR